MGKRKEGRGKKEANKRKGRDKISAKYISSYGLAISAAAHQRLNAC